MKFGNNLEHLSIPEWRCYNLAYNDLKYQIRQITQSKSTNLAPLHKAFIENFDYINLFVQTKHGELVRKFNYFDSYFNQLVSVVDTCNKSKLRSILIEIDEIFYQIIEISLVLKNLSKFILIQKIALKKIFKKFLKYYNQDKQKSLKFVVNLKNYLLLNKFSFINFDLSDLTLKLTNIITSIKYEQKRFNNLIDDSPEDAYAESEINQPQTKSTYHIQQDPPTPDANFDLVILLKKNFSLHCLIPDDSNTLNELVLNLNIYLNFKNYIDTSYSFLSYIYLTQESDLYAEPSYVITQKNSPVSIIIGHTGGLRKYCYCILPNEVVQLFLDHLNDRKNDDIRSRLFDYFQENDVSPLTRKTLDSILKGNRKPTMKLLCKRARYILKKSGNDDDDDDEYAVAEEGEGTSSDKVKREYQDDYLVTLDHDICTTNNTKYASSLSFFDDESNESEHYSNVFENFPHNHLSFYSNDSNLCNFENSLETEIDVKDGLLVNNYSSSLLRKLPTKIQNLITSNNSLSLFKGLNFYQYMISCYFNLVPRGDYAKNHYSYLLNLNLLKNFENIENFANQMNSENSIIKAKSNRILRHQLSMKSLDTRAHYTNLNTSHCPEFYLKSKSNKSSPSETVPNNSLGSQTSTRLSNQSIFTNNGKNDDDEPDIEDENEALAGISPTELSRFRQAQFGVDDDDDIYGDDDAAVGNNDYSFFLQPPTFMDRNKFVNIQYQYEMDYDQTLTYIYFSLNILSIFLSGIELGIVYSIFMKIDGDSQFLLVDNVWLVLVLVMGLLLSLIFSMMSINLIFQRYHQAPLFHSFVIWSGFSVVCLCCIWSVFIFIDAGGT
ncbi:predicted protein [Scheffersomyces stipitis CBS 6054]|uniref:SPX domain-containing protein n=1 Tax=Scheffersomyces stipitis (strain ATCC 58785 / CBS 6054 / NBRC 10063 / NRRL Y-11545) TaxID=322104 RepID=A3LQ76_PICST|nr:predicted protein [Scheffersomyces stipitis CBS 6054]ABN64631.2 predicted protein [Scheffersomyces stipitis CBS 6054]